MIIKAFLSILIILATGYIGFCIAKIYKDRINFFDELNTILIELKNSINFSQTILKDFIVKQEIVSKSVNKIFANYLCYLDSSNGELSLSDLFCGVYILSQNEKQSVYNFFASLGRQDVNSQNTLIDGYLAINNNYKTTAENRWKNSGKISTKLGVLFGAVIVMIII